jgi:hypothetical protein
MAPKGSGKGMGKATARAAMPTSVTNRCLSSAWGNIQGFIAEQICALILMYTVYGVKDEMAWDLFYDMIFLDLVRIRHISQDQKPWQHCRSRFSPFRE